jgi:DNA-binding protein H-NS
VNTSTLDNMTTRDLLKLQADVAAALVKSQENDKAAATQQLRAELRAYAEKFEQRLAEISPVPVGNSTTQTTQIKRTPSVRKAKPKGALPPKYRSGDNVWSGRGKQPKWMTDRIRGGAKQSDFLIQTSA